MLQAALNPATPDKKERAFGDIIFREGDRVMQIRNNYDILWKKTDGSAVGTGIFNGDVGTITGIDTGAETLTVTFDDRAADYDFTQLNELEPAYAMTVHKSQGSEYRAVILAAWNGSPYLLSRSILYTAITRARELLIIVGREETVAAMVENAKKNRRYTGLKLRLQGKPNETGSLAAGRAVPAKVRSVRQRSWEKEELDLCRTCREEAPEFLNRKRRCQFLDSFAAVWYYEGNVRRSLLRFKFGGARNYAAAYGRLLAMRIQNQYPDGFDVLTWIPVSRLRKLRRGYDQVELLAKTVGRELGMTPTPLLRKVRHNRPQSGIHGEAERRANVLGVYRLTQGVEIAGKRILLLDDILTTGATAGEAARVLKTAGAKEVHCAAVASAGKE